MNYIKDCWTKEDVKEFDLSLKEMADEKYRNFHSKLVPNMTEFYGITTPQMRKIAKEISKGNFLSFLENCVLKLASPYEIKVIYGMVIGVCKADNERKVNLVKNYLCFIDNWAVCDIVTSDLKFIKGYKAEFLDVIKPCFLSENEFTVRFGVVVLLDYYLDIQYIDHCLNIFDTIKHDGYYVKMAVAWAVSVAYIKCPEQTMKFLKNNHLDSFTYNKALQKLRESYRVSKEDKELFKSMKVGKNDK